MQHTCGQPEIQTQARVTSRLGASCYIWQPEMALQEGQRASPLAASHATCNSQSRLSKTDDYADLFGRTSHCHWNTGDSKSPCQPLSFLPIVDARETMRLAVWKVLRATTALLGGSGGCTQGPGNRMACTPHCPVPQLLLLGGSCRGGARRSQWDARLPTLME